MTTTNARRNAGRSPFGSLLLRLRTDRGLTQEGLAKATKGSSLAHRSITNYERATDTPQEWILPHRPVLRLLAEAMDLDMVDHHALVTAWTLSRNLRTSKPATESASTFVSAGREEALGIVMGAWEKVLAGTPQVVMLQGIAGIGKTALARHISDRIAESTREVMITWGGASSWASEIEPYLTFRSATDRILTPPDAASNVPGDYPSRPKLGRAEVDRIIKSIPLLAGGLISERALRGMVSALGEDYQQSINAALASGSSTETLGRHEEYFHLLMDLAASWPIVMVLEDLHWSGEQTATLLLHLARQFQHRRGTRILFVLTYRNEDLPTHEERDNHPFTRLLESMSYSSQVSIISLNDAMSPTAGMAFVRGIVQQTPMASPQTAEELGTYLYNQTSGHPLLTSELKRHLVETGALVQNLEGDWEFDISKTTNETPAPISSFIAQRLQRVSHAGKRILEIAAVMDDVIMPEVVADAAQSGIEDILETIDTELVDHHQFLLPGTPVRAQKRFQAVYRFPHALFREHIYNGLPTARRQRLHQMIAESMENRYDDADDATLRKITSHYVAAQDWHSAEMAAYRLAQQSVIRLDWDLAELWFAQAEELALRAEDPPQLWRARAARLAMLRGTGRYDQAIETGQRILKLANIHNWPETLALTLHHLGEVYYDLGYVDKAVDHLARAIELHTEGGALDLAAAGEAMLSHATFRQGKYDVARTHAQNALELSRSLKNSWVQPEAVLAVANCELDLGFFELAVEHYEVARELASMVGKLQNQFIPGMNIGLSYTLMGNHQKAADVLTDLIEQMESLKILRLTAPARLYLGMAQEGLGNLDAAENAYKQASMIRRTNVTSPTLFDSLAGELRIAMQKGQDQVARKHLLEITSHLDQHGWEGIEYPLIVMVSLAHAERFFGNAAGYRDHINRAHALLLERAALIEDPDARNSYLTNVPVSVEIQQLHAALNEEVRKR